MAVQWYCNISGETFGPMSAHQLKAMAKNGMLAPQHLVWHEAKGSWIPAEQVNGLFTQEIPQAKAVPVPPEPNQVGFATNSNAPVDPAAGGSTYGQTSRKRRRKNNTTVVVALVLLIVGLTVVAIALLTVNSDSEKKPTADTVEAAETTRVKQKDIDELIESEKIEDLTDESDDSPDDNTWRVAGPPRQEDGGDNDRNAGSAEDVLSYFNRDGVEGDPKDEFRRDNPELFGNDDENDSDKSLEGKLNGFK